MGSPARELPIRLVDGPVKHDHADHAFESGGRTAVPPPPKARVFVEGQPISEQAIGQEMQHHPAIRPEESWRAAAEALVVQRLLQLETARLSIDGTRHAEPGESAEEAATRVLLEPVFDLVRPATSEACQHYFEQNREHFRAPDRVQLRHILYPAAPDDIEARLASRDRAEHDLAELKAHPERFAEYAMRFSACPSKEQGGELGWIERGQTTPEFERQVFRLKPGLAGLPVESRFGHHIVEVLALEKGALLDLDQVQSDIALRLDLAQRHSAMKQYVESLMARYSVEGLDAAL
ncbi:peptidylprolyl isomerase [Pseudomarimonas arenosa]|uniref:peptidylprolyl isomerase n=1 Tax=Pseudomarimonas arenosa TaxID=2774145 RepID=A0AAW3ZPM9_9GAMM|nr:peptidylprolyl isomerase [Pseudomarimonas arenosa]MBD8526286.1 peptidylprolyl isomerase [Pseudomarimonas arenosa]